MLGLSGDAGGVNNLGQNGLTRNKESQFKVFIKKHDKPQRCKKTLFVEGSWTRQQDKDILSVSLQQV